jgi:hypothetical protein
MVGLRVPLGPLTHDPLGFVTSLLPSYLLSFLPFSSPFSLNGRFSIVEGKGPVAPALPAAPDPAVLPPIIGVFIPAPAPGANFPEGVRGYDTAVTGRAKCGVCKGNLELGRFRLRYRFKVGKSIKDEAWLHPVCVRGTPLGNRDSDRIRTQRLLDAADDPRAVEGLMLALRTLGGAAAGSGG